MLKQPASVRGRGVCCAIEGTVEDDYAFNENIKKNIIHKSTYLSGFVMKSTVKKWLDYLVQTPLHKHYNITVDVQALSSVGVNNKDCDSSTSIDTLNVDEVAKSEALLARQHTMLQNEEQCLHIAPGRNRVPYDIVYDKHTEELSFPAIYYGHARAFNLSVTVTLNDSNQRDSSQRPQSCRTKTLPLYGDEDTSVRVMDGIYNGDNDTLRLWLHFDSVVIGAKLRMKMRLHIPSKPGVLCKDWTPVHKRTANITVYSGPLQIKCRRVQFPLVSACAITIHKSQGGTFDRIVYQQDKSQQNQLVYVALSRVTSLDGLYLINSKNDFKFYHARGTQSPSVKQLRDEYA